MLLDRIALLALSLWVGALLALNFKASVVLVLVAIVLALAGLILKANLRISALILILVVGVGAIIATTHQRAKELDIENLNSSYTLTFTARSDSAVLKQRVYGSDRSEKRCSLKAEMKSVNDGSFLLNRSLPIRIISTACDLSYGEQVVAKGKFVATEEKRMSALFIADQVIERKLSRFWSQINFARMKFRGYFRDSSISGASLVPGMVIGDTTLQSREFQDLMQRVGLSHLTAVSGTNFAIVSTFLLALLSRTVKNFPLRIAISAISLILFTFLVRPTPSVLRAAVMAAVFLLSKIRGSRKDGFTALGVATIVLIAIDPFQALEAGFALSVLATAGILIFSPLLTQFFIDQFSAPKLIAELLAIPLAASIFCTPVIVAISQEISLAQVPINIAVAPFVPLITIAGFLTFLTQFLFAPFQFIPEFGAQIASFSAIAVVALADIGLAFPVLEIFHKSNGRSSGGLIGALVSATLIALFLFVISQLRTQPRYLWLFLALIFSISYLLPAIMDRGKSDWQLIQCDVGQGDGLLIKTSEKSAVVIDVGPDPQKMDRCLREGKINKISLLVLTHFHADHVAGLSALVSGREVERWWIAPITQSSDELLLASSLLKSDPIVVQAGDRYQIGNILLHVIWPEADERFFSSIPGDGSDLNNRSITLMIEKDGAVIFAGGDIEPAVQKILAAKYDLSSVDIYKVSHHGSKFRSEEFDQELNPLLALFSVGAGNRYGHPAAETLGKFRASLIARTDQQGLIRVKWWPLEISH